MAENVSRPPNWAVDTPIGIQTASSSSHHGNKTTNSTTSTTITTQQQHHQQMVQYQNQIPPQPPPPPQHQQINQVLRPDTVVLRRQDGHGFGFTLRHFIVYPPDSSSESQNAANSGALALIQPMDTVFVKEVRPYGPAHLAGLNTGDRLLAVNGMPVAGTPYARVVAAIQQTPATLTLQVVPKECDILQTFFSETAHNPETNQRPRLYSPPTNAAIPTVAAAIPHESQHHNQKHQKAQQTKVAATGQNEILAQHHQNIIESQQRLLSAGGRNADGMQEGTAGITTVEMHCNNNINQSRDQHESDVVNGMYSRPKAEPQVAMKSRRRGGGDEIIQVHHTVGSNMGNGQVRLHAKHHHHHNHSQQQQQQQTNLSRPDNRSILVYDTHFSHLNPDAYDRRESSSSVASSLGSYDSGSTLTSDLGDSAIMTRLRKSFEQKEEFLRRPSQPIGYISETPPTTAAAVEQTSVKQREFYGRPQRLQKSIWPPIEQQPPYHPNRNQENIIESEYETISSPPPGHRPDNYMQAPSLERDFNKQQHQQRLQSPPMPLQVKSTNIPNSAIKIANHIAREQFYNGQNPQQMLMLSNDKQQQQQHQQQMDEFNSMETEDNCRFIPNAGLHIVSERTKQFESGRPLSPDGQLIDRTSLYRSELSRLSTKRPVPNVAVRRREFELIAENSDWRKISSDDNDQSSSFDSISEGSIRHPAVRARSLSADSTRNEQSLRSDRSQVHSLTDDQLSREFSRKQPCRQNSYIEAVRHNTTSGETTQVVRRQRTLTEDEDDERPMRRVSYLRATANETALQTESDMDQSPMSMPPGTPDTDEQAAAQALRSSKLKALSYLRDSPADPSLPVLRDGELNVKVTFIDGKRSQDRSWKTVWAEIRGNKLKLTIHREGKSSQSPEPSGIIDLRSFHVTEGNYTKRKHVFKLTSAIVPPQSPNSGGLTAGGRGDISSSPTGNGTEILIQTDSQQDMKLWMENLRSACGNDAVRSQDYINSIGTQNAEPQRIAGTTIIQTDDAISPVSPTKPARKITLGTRSPSGQSPVTKSRKTPQQTNVFSTEKRDQKDYSIKGLVVRGLRKIQGNSESPHQIDQPPEGASIGVSVQQCPMSEENEHVPFIVTRCTKIVESRGMGVIGIYRIPGNTAAITALAELVNRGFDDNCMNDPKWDDVNVVSSLLKLFIRKLPDGLLPNEMYQHFIDSDKLFGIERLKEIKKLLEKLPPYSYETLKHLMRHLNRVSNNCVINLMEPRNLAIVFGPSVVRTSSETLESAVKDMKHQCRIVEAFVLHYLFFFENESLPQLTDACEASINLVPEAQNTNLLLDNVAKIEQKETNFVTHIVQAANRKIRRNTYRKSTTSATPDTLSLDSNTSAESKEPMKRFGSDDSASIRRRGSTTDDVIKSEDDLSALDERSMSLNTVTLELDNKLRTLRSTGTPTKTATNPTNTNCNSPSASEKPLATNKPLCLGENIPYADESPERPIIPMRSKPMRILPRNDLLQTPTPPNSPAEFLLSPSAIRSSTTGHTMRSQDMDKLSPPSPQTPSGASSDETDASTTSNPRDNPPLPALPPPTSSSSSSRRINTDVLREILTELENKDKVKSMKTKLNRSLSLNYKNHRDECCCNNSRGVASSSSSTTAVHNRFSLTKDEKTDKNISKKRQLQDMRNYRRHTASGNRSIKRRHTVGGTHDYSRKNGGSGGGGNGNANSAVDGATCQGYVSTDLSSPDWMSRKKEMKASHLQDQENCRY